MHTIACDMGGTRIKLGLVKDGRILAAETIPAFSGKGLKPRLPEIAETIRKLCSQAEIKLKECIGMAIASPGVISADNRQIVSMNEKYFDAPSLNLVKWADEELGIPLFIENDARMATIGEWKYGAGIGHDYLVMMTLGTGLGTSAVIDGRILKGFRGIGGLLGGHFTVNYDGPVCTCGNIGCSEIEASTVSISKLAHAHPEFGRSKLAAESSIEYEAVFRYAAEGDECSRYLLNHSLKIWSITVLNLVHAYDPEIVILGGGIMASGDIIIPVIQDYLEKHTWNPWEKPRVVKALNGNNAALIACEWLVKSKI